jgi:isoquinoline 1-oxidoreductase subunit beta
MLHTLSQQLAQALRPAGEQILLENVSRRSFLKGTASGVGLVVAMQIVPLQGARAMESYPTGGLSMPNGIVTDPHVFVSIDPDGTVTIVAHRSEMGTGSRTSLPMVLADEMEADWARVKIVQAPGDEPTYGNQDTDGSRSMRHHIQPMRQMGAAVRQMLEQAAAGQWGVDAGEVKAVNHEVVHEASGRRVGYGDLAEQAMALPVPAFESLSFKDESDFRYIGKGAVQIYDLHDITTGKAVYGADVHLPGMRYAVIARPPVVGGKVRSVDSSAALAVPGVEKVVEIEGNMPPAKFARSGVSRWWPPTPGRQSRAARRSRSSGRTAHTAPTAPSSITRTCRPRQPSPARRCATRATWTLPSGVPPRSSAQSTISRTWRTSPWSRRRRLPASLTGRPRSGRRSRAPGARGRTWPRRSVCRSRT